MWAFVQTSLKELRVATDPLLWIASLTLMGIAPFLFLILTCFARVSMVLIFVRHGLGVGNVPSNTVLNGLALLLTLHVMAPVGVAMAERATALCTHEDGSWSAPSLADIGVILEPWTAFLSVNAGEAEREVARQLRADTTALDASPDDPLVLATAFVLTELQRAIAGGVYVLLPFLLIDLLVGLILLALGMHMLSPTSVSPAIKLLLFVSIDGWMTLSLGLRGGYEIPVLPDLPL